MEINNLYYGILLYIIIVAMLVFAKPDFIYDHKKSKYKEYGTTENKTIFTLPIIAVLLAILIAIVIVMSSKKDQPIKQNMGESSNNNSNLSTIQPTIQYIPVYYQTMPQFQNLQPIQYIQQSQLQQLQQLQTQ